MTKKIKIFTPSFIKDKDAFSERSLVLIKEVYAYQEDKNTTERWANNTILEDATCMFTFRYIDGITNEIIIECENRKYFAISVENVRHKNRYIQVVAKLEVPVNG